MKNIIGIDTDRAREAAHIMNSSSPVDAAVQATRNRSKHMNIFHHNMYLHLHIMYLTAILTQTNLLSQSQSRSSSAWWSAGWSGGHGPVGQPGLEYQC